MLLGQVVTYLECTRDRDGRSRTSSVLTAQFQTDKRHGGVVSPESTLIALSAAVILVLGIAHLLATYAGSKLEPRDSDLLESMKAVPPNISKQTTMWKAWVGFNASHSLGAIVFALVFGYLAVGRSDLLFDSPFLLSLGLVTLLSYSAMGWLYWFHIPFRGIMLSLLLYISGLLVAWTA